MQPIPRILAFGVILCLLAGCSPPAAATATPLPPPSPTASQATNPPAGTPAAPSFDTLKPLAAAFVDLLVMGDFSTAFSSFDDTMKNALPEARLKQTWEQLIAQVGAFQQQTGMRTTEAKGYFIVFVSCQFEKAAIDVRVVFNNQAQISGLFFSPSQTAGSNEKAYNPPVYVNRASFQEAEVTLGSGEWALPATLSLPNGDGPFPGVVLVHGSGPNDRDESIGPNKPFRDLAWGLASQGVAVLRYDKRTLVHASLFTPEILATLTVQEETIDDALLAARLLRETKGIDPRRVYVLGHSLGAMVAPRIGQQDASLAGLILMAAPARPLEDLALEQFTYLYNLDGVLSDQEKADLEVLKTQVARVKDANLPLSTSRQDLPLNISPVYWLDLRGYQPVEAAGSLVMPLLVLQGGRDYQVSPVNDFEVWKAAFTGKTSVTLKLYPDLNHLFISGEGQPNPQEYETEGHVSVDVVNDIAGWIKQ